MADCASNMDTLCDEMHAPPVQLRSLGEQVPQYLELAIAMCHLKNLNQKPAAWQLLKILPSVFSPSQVGVFILARDPS